MKHTIAKMAAAATIAAAALIIAPAAAQASSYTPTDTAVVSSTTVAPGGVFTFGVADGTFLPGEGVIVTISGENASGASLASVQTAVETNVIWSGSATDAGAIDPFGIRLPANASGEYTVLAVSESGRSTTPVVITVPAGAGGAAAPGTDGSSLPATGMDSGSLLGIWVGGGALLLVGGGLAVAGAVRHNRKQAA